MSALSLMLSRSQAGIGSAWTFVRQIPHLFTEKVVFRASVWTVLGFGVGQFLRFASNLVLTRLLVPEVFGLMAITTSLMLGLSLFSDIGIHRSIVQNKRGEEKDFLNTAWTIQLIRGVILFLVSLAAAFPMAHVYGDDRLLWLVPAMGLTNLSWGLNSTSLITLNRRMQVGRLCLFEVTIQAISLCVCITIVYFTRSIAGLIQGILFGEALRVVASHFLIKGYRNKLAWDKEAAGEIIHFGKWLMLSSSMTFLATQSDRLILGHFFSLTFIGIYMIAYALSEVPRQVMRKLNKMVLLPEVCRCLDKTREDLRAFIIRRRKLLLLAATGGVALLVSAGDLAILWLFDPRYEAGAWILPIMASGLWVSALAITADPVLYALGKPKIPSMGNLVKFICLVVAIPAAALTVGPIGAIIVIAWSDIPYYIAVAYGLKRSQLCVVRQDVIFTLLVIPLTALLILCRYWMGLGTPMDTFFSAGEVMQEWFRQ